MNTPVREGETIEGSRTMRNRPYQVLKAQGILEGVEGELTRELKLREAATDERVGLFTPDKDRATRTRAAVVWPS